MTPLDQAPRWADQGWVQLLAFGVLCVVLALPYYTDVSQRWAAGGAIAWAVVFLALHMSRRSQRR